MEKQHSYSLTIEWTGNKGEGTSGYKNYERSHVIKVAGKPDIECSSDPAFRGDKSKYNPEEMLVASLSTCHMLWYLHLCGDAGVVVIAYHDEPKGTMVETSDGGGYFTEVVLHPHVVITSDAMIEKANALHAQAHKLCFIANSVNFEVKHEPQCKCG